MKKFIYFISSIAVAMSFTSCMTFDSTSYNNTTDGSNSSFITDRPYKVIEEVSIREKSNYVLLIGGYKKNKKENVLHELQMKANLKSNQALVNISYSKTYRGFIFPVIWYQINNCAYGTIIEFTDEHKAEEQNLGKNTDFKTDNKNVTKNPTYSSRSILIPDNEFKKYLLNHFDINHDKEISEEEASVIKQIDCTFWGIHDLTGIEKMPNLEVLNAEKNAIKSVNLQNNRRIKTVNLTDKYLSEVIICSSCYPTINFSSSKITRK